MDICQFVAERGLDGVVHPDIQFHPNCIQHPAPQNAIILANSGVMIETSSSLCRNEKGRFYRNGEGFSEADWANYMQLYVERLVDCFLGVDSSGLSAIFCAWRLVISPVLLSRLDWRSLRQKSKQKGC